VEGFHAAHAGRIGTQALVRAEAAAERDGTRQFWLTNGYTALLDWFSETLSQREVSILLNTSVSAIRWRRGLVNVLAKTPNGPRTFTAEQAVITLPLGVLQASGPDGVAFEPALEDKARAVSGLAMGNVVKLTLEFRERFWPTENFGFIHSANLLFPTWWSDKRGPLLTAWAGGAQADKVDSELLAKSGSQALVQHATRELSEVFQTDISKIDKLLAGVHLHNWRKDPFSGGAYSYTPTRMIEMPNLLASPVAETLYFAGEATDSSGEQGTVHAALASGKRAARELLESRKQHLRAESPELNFRS
jgi:monoamine oxidase